MPNRTIDQMRQAARSCKQNIVEGSSDGTVANIMITQIRQIDAMLAKVIRKIEADFIANGGLKESMTRARRQQRGY